MINRDNEALEITLDKLARGGLDRRRFLEVAGSFGLIASLNAAGLDQALAASETQQANRARIRDSYDYVVVGAGTAGCILAAGLAEAGADILLVEAGGSDNLRRIRTPGMWFTNVGGERDWHMHTAPSRYLAGRRAPVSAGRVLGGGGSINAMAWVRGLASDFDGWSAGGCNGWRFEDLLPIFKRIEDWQGGANAWRGTGGPVSIITSSAPHPTARAFREAARDMGMPVRDDLNAPMREGAGYLNLNITKQGTRASTARCFLRPALARSNLTLLLDKQVTKLAFVGSRCTGATILDERGGLRTISATREVLVTSGGIGSAKLLMLSGIGDADDLRPQGIEMVANLKGVGRNLQDHALLLGVVLSYKGKMPPISPISNAGEVAAFVRSSKAGTEPDLEILTSEYPAATPEIRGKFGAPPADAFTVAASCIRPTSRGTVRLQDKDWRTLPVIDGAYLATEHDLDVAAEGIELARELGRQKGFDEIRVAELIPGQKPDKDALRDFVRNAAISFGHSAGTCRMGRGTDAVVDPELRVHGIDGLRVCDSSIMPTIVSGPTNAATHVIASKSLDMITAR
jgi:choline dehydrogenase